MEIRTARLLLREWRRELDALALVRHANHVEVWRNTGGMPFPYLRSDAEAFFARCAERAEEVHCAIVLGGEPIGGIGMYRRAGLERFTAEIGYWLGPSCWGRGYASEAARAFTEHAFASTDLERIEGRVFAWNPASGRVLEKAGFAREGLKRRSAFKDDQFVDEFLYARLRGE
jgi:ribosomal-protein-alanine N-acetyltransferase